MISFAQLGKLGRLGNQLFQIAATIALAVRNDDQYVIPPWEYSQFFNLRNCFSLHINPTETYREPHFHYAPIPHHGTQNSVLDLVGYFQSEKYFQDCRDIICNLLTPNIGFGIKWGYTSIHVRRGDYLHLTREYIQSNMDYYRRAMDVIKSPKYLVFSDDIEWCKANFSGDSIEFSEGKSPVEDLALQLACENNIITNSSFSWWAAYLNANPSKIVVAPSKWFGPGLPHDTKDLLSESWVKV